MTVGELARKAGVTVRTIQYYDQKGLLAPSAKGPQGQRLYTTQDLEGLYRILTLKYLGLSLSDISRIPDVVPPAMFRALVGKSQQKIEEEFGALLVRMSTLRSLDVASEDCISWGTLSRIIDGASAQASSGSDSSSLSEGAPVSSADKVDSWHHIIDKTIELMNAHVPSDSPEAVELADRLLAADGGKQTLEGEFQLIQGSMPESHRRGDFGVMVNKVFEYLHSAANQQAHTRGDVGGVTDSLAGREGLVPHESE